MQDILVEQNIIITEPCKTLRTLGRNALAGKWKPAIIAMIVYLVVMELPVTVFDALFGKNVGSFMTNDGYTYGMSPDFYVNFYNNMPQTSVLSSLYVLLVTGPMMLGLTLYFLATFRKHNVELADIFLGFEKFGKALGLFLYQALFIFLWTLLFIVPGIIASIRYSQAFFILADDPDKGIRQCMNESKAMMKGNKAKYFLLSLSFIGWALLAMIPAGIFSSIGTTVSNNAFVAALFSIIGILFTAPLLAYVYSTFAGFYEILAGHLIKETMPVPVTAEEAKEQYETIQAITAEAEKPAEEVKTAEAEVTETEVTETTEATDSTEEAKSEEEKPAEEEKTETDE